MSLDVTGFITWIRTFLDDVYAEKGTSGTDLELDLIPKSENSNGVVCIKGGDVNYDLDKVYPVGSIYMSVNSTNPSTLFGGTWVQLTDTFLYATSTTADANVTTATDGEATHTLTIEEMPRHNHSASINLRYLKNSATASESGHVTAWSNHWETQMINGSVNKGGGQAHNNMPPYMKVYMWKRTQ